jgi:bacillithiol biosynthesis deacetylase BshB1
MKLDILAFAAHPDDVELAASGTVAAHIAKGYKVGIIDLTQGELGTRGNAALRAEESAKASELLGIHVRENLHMRDGFFLNDEVHQLKIIECIRAYQPEMVLCNAINDRHIDHGRAAKLVADACFLSGLRKIETKRNGELQQAWRPKNVYHYIQDYYLKPDVVVDITPYFEQKMKSIKAYSSQFYNPDANEPETPISGSDFLHFIEARAREMGRIIGVTYAEGFNTARTPGVNDLFHLK